MFSWFSKSKPAPVFDAPLEPQAPLAVVGDIHGSAGLLSRFLNDLPPNRHVIFVGDYIDRGEDSAKVLRLLMQLQSEHPEKITCLMGNHERMMLDFLDAPERNGRRWLNSGGMQTLASFGVQPPSGTAGDDVWLQTRDYLEARLGTGLESWVRALPLQFKSGNIAVVHAAADPSIPIDAQDPHVLLWGSPDFTRVPRGDGIWVAHGHTIVPEPIAQDGRIATDTGAYATGRLTAALIDPGEISFQTI